ncbi:MAG: diguanylate cyclase, partial [Epsilonproteobacteria bacterium]|nr:diguanylate cyclase [Campylobacterota bacterium]
HGEEALGILSNNHDITLVITDFHMPVMDGLELTKEIRKSYKKSDLAIIALSSSQDSETTALFLKHGANDYIKKDFSKEEFTCRIHNTIEALENIHIITNQSSRDFLTGAYNRRHFYKEMQPYFAQNHNGGERFAVAMIAIDDFKRLSDTYGYESAERAIVLLGEILRSSTNYRDVVARFSGEEFCVVLKNINSYSALDIFGRISELVQESSFIAANGELVRFSVSIGIALTHDETLEESINQADMNLFNAQQKGKAQIVHS